MPCQIQKSCFLCVHNVIHFGDNAVVQGYQSCNRFIADDGNKSATHMPPTYVRMLIDVFFLSFSLMTDDEREETEWKMRR